MTEEQGMASHDPDFPDRLREFMRTGWRDRTLDVSPLPEAPQHAKRRAAVAEAFPGDTLVIPSGTPPVRANDTHYRFRPGSDFAYLTGEHDPDSVLVIRPGGEAVLYVRPRSPRGTDGFFRDRVYGELWGGRRPTLTEKATQLGVETPALDRLAAALDDLAPARTRVLRGLDPTVDAAVRGYPERDAELARPPPELRVGQDRGEVAEARDAGD